MVDEMDAKEDNWKVQLATYSVVCFACSWDSQLVVEMVAYLDEN